MFLGIRADINICCSVIAQREFVAVEDTTVKN